MPSFNIGVVSSSYEFPVVTGGTIYSDSEYYYHVFTSTDNLVVSNNSIEVEVLAIGGGGQGGN